MTLALRQTLAIVLDAVRRLRAAKLFWLSLALSLLVAALFGVVGIDDRGLVFPFYGTLDIPFLNTTVVPVDAFYKVVFLTLGVGIWLAWASIILALISTADLIPSLVGDGSADLYLSRPLGRVRLLLTRYATGLLFVAAQAVCFSVASILVIGLRGGVWLPALLLTVPTIVVFFSFLYCVSAFVGLVTRSGVAAILATLLVWFVAWSADTADQTVLAQLEGARANIESGEFAVLDNARLRERLAGAGPAARQTAEGNTGALSAELERRRAQLPGWRRAHRIIMAVKAPLPKTGETVTVLSRLLVDAADLEGFRGQFSDTRVDAARDRAVARNRDPDEAARREQAEISGEQRAEALYANRPWWWSLGTSFAFQAVLLAACCVVFARRDL